MDDDRNSAREKILTTRLQLLCESRRYRSVNNRCIDSTFLDQFTFLDNSCDPSSAFRPLPFVLHKLRGAIFSFEDAAQLVLELVDK